MELKVEGEVGELVNYNIQNPLHGVERVYDGNFSLNHYLHRIHYMELKGYIYPCHPPISTFHHEESITWS
jgi:hypothetical protein